jgi:hypothetical protein
VFSGWETGLVQFFHGTLLDSAIRFLGGELLNAATAASLKVDGDAGFFLATHDSAAEFFAARRGIGAVIVMEIEEADVEALLLVGALLRPIVVTGRSPDFEGEELWVPPGAFGVFNQLLTRGRVNVHP